MNLNYFFKRTSTFLATAACVVGFTAAAIPAVAEVDVDTDHFIAEWLNERTGCDVNPEKRLRSQRALVRASVTTLLAPDATSETCLFPAMKYREAEATLISLLRQEYPELPAINNLTDRRFGDFVADARKGVTGHHTASGHDGHEGHEGVSKRSRSDLGDLGQYMREIDFVNMSDPMKALVIRQQVKQLSGLTELAEVNWGYNRKTTSGNVTSFGNLGITNIGNGKALVDHALTPQAAEVEDTPPSPMMPSEQKVEATMEVAKSDTVTTEEVEDDSTSPTTLSQKETNADMAPKKRPSRVQKYITY